MTDRKSFLKKLMLGGLAPFAGRLNNGLQSRQPGDPIVISTWNNREANEAAWKVLQEGGPALDAVEAGARIPEQDPDDHSVGLGGWPDREGHVTLDACIMDHGGHCGSVAFLEDIVHPVSVARKVMEETDHVMLVGEGARLFALSQGFEPQDLLTDEAREFWEKRSGQEERKPRDYREDHDTIGILALDQHGNLSGACTTSGASMKLRGRVGDSPIIGAGLFVDNEVGAASATGRGEEVIRTAGSHLVVELMRQGYDPTAACREAVRRILTLNPAPGNMQVGYIALNKAGQIGGYSIRDGFSYAVHNAGGAKTIDSEFER